MPVIKPPRTTGDGGAPSESLWSDANRVFAFIDDERHFAALKLFKTVEQRWLELSESLIGGDDKENSKGHGRFKSLKRGNKKEKALHDQQRQEVERVGNLLDLNAKLITKLKNQCRLFGEAKRSLNLNEDWTLAQTLFGITTYYRRESDGSLSVKIEGQLEGVPLFEQVAVLREVDLHFKWAPFCSSSLTITHLDKLDTVGWFIVGLPNFGIARDGCFRAIGCDSIEEDGCILLVGEGLEDLPTNKGGGSQSQGHSHSSVDSQEHQPYSLRNDPIVDDLNLPPVPTRIGSGRMTIRKFQASIEVLSPTSATSKLIANIDPNLSLLPQSLLDFLMKKLCGVLLHKLQAAAKKVAKDPVANPHAMKMRQEEAFYKDWLMVKFQHICKIRGWDMPPVPAFDLDPQQRIRALRAEEKAALFSKKKFMHSHSNEAMLQRGLQHQPESAASEPTEVGRGMRQLASYRTNSCDSDTISEISLNSSSTMSSRWKNNPVATYLREIEEKTQQRKIQVISKARQAAANRLRPKRLQLDQRTRLAELQAAKGSTPTSNAHDSNGAASRSPTSHMTATSTTSDKFQNMKSLADFKMKWNEHGYPLRAGVLIGLVVVLFATLNSEPGIGKSLFSSKDDRWYLATAKDVATVLYMTLAAGLHFALCYSALMYSFSALYIGQIAGPQARKFYSENVHLVVASSSGAMVILALAKVTLGFLLRQVTWYMILLRKLPSLLISYSNPWNYEVIASWWYRMQSDTKVGNVITESVIPPMVTFFQYIQDGGSFVVNSLVVIGQTLSRLILESNVIGRLLANSLSKGWTIVRSTWDGYMEYEANVVAIMEKTTAAESWRRDAFGIARHMLSYSAIFLLTLLFLFTLSARYARVQKGADKPKKQTVPRFLTPSRSPSLKARFETIKEEDEASQTHGAPIVQLQ